MTDLPTPSSELQGRVALVTGAALRTGRALALALAHAGADVLIHYRSSHAEAESLAAEVSALGRRAQLVAADLADPDAVDLAFGQAIEEMGRLDILVNNVGTIVWKKLDDLTTEDWRRCLEGTLFATLHASRAALPALRESGHGRIINLLDADADSTDPVPFATAYKIGKRGTFTLTKTMAVEEAEHGVTVNAVSPGTLEDSPTKPALSRIPAGRYGTYADLASAVLFLASDSAGYMTGAHLKVSGGYLV
jgi:NAD(P)-dependent dehydrogenase (short-subunit alcohol dehydrogenase family)